MSFETCVALLAFQLQVETEYLIAIEEVERFSLPQEIATIASEQYQDTLNKIKAICKNHARF